MLLQSSRNSFSSSASIEKVFSKMFSIRSNVKLRRATIQDIEDLHSLIVQSSSGQETLSISSLRDDLFPMSQVVKPDVTSSDASLELDLELFELQRPLTQAILAEIDDRLEGYALFHYYYTPWVGHGVFIDDIFVKSCVEDIDEAIHLLLEKVIEEAKEDNLKMVVFNESRLLLKICPKNEDEFCCIRGPQSDWSVLRIHLDEKKTPSKQYDNK